MENSTAANASSLSCRKLMQVLSNPKNGNPQYNITDSAGNLMQCISVIDLINQDYKYAAVYHTPYLQADKKSYMYHVNLSLSNDLLNWTYQGMLLSNADMPEIRRAENGEWIVLIHEQWMNVSPTGGSAAPCQIGFKLFYNDASLLSLQYDSTWLAPQFSSGLNGTPNFYTLNMNQDDKGYWFISGAVGFHFWNTGSVPNRDMVANAAITNVFNPNPLNPPSWLPSEAGNYNNMLIADGVTGNIGQRCSILTADGRFNIQEGNLGAPAASWADWRIFVYGFNDEVPWPSGDGEFYGIYPQTEGGSKSFGNPRVSVVADPVNSAGQCLVVSYFLFGEGAGPHEAGGLLYHHTI